jgi:hypothetical protein
MKKTKLEQEPFEKKRRAFGGLQATVHSLGLYVYGIRG